VVQPIQFDIAHVPLKTKIDILYCVNVIQHTKDAKETFNSLCRLMDETTLFLFNVYTDKPSAKIIVFLRSLTTKLPFSLVKYLSTVPALLYYLIQKARLSKVFGQYHTPYIRSFKEIWLDMYDLLGKHYYQAYMKKADQLAMIKNEGLLILKETNFGYLLKKVN
jgi:hypothetical protein